MPCYYYYAITPEGFVDVRDDDCKETIVTKFLKDKLGLKVNVTYPSRKWRVDYLTSSNRKFLAIMSINSFCILIN